MASQWYMHAPGPGKRPTDTPQPTVAPPTPRECLFDEDSETAARERVGKVVGSTQLTHAQEQVLKEMRERREAMRERREDEATP